MNRPLLTMYERYRLGAARRSPPANGSTPRLSDRGLIFSLIRVRSSTCIDIQINAAMQVTNMCGIPRTITPTPEIGRLAVEPLPYDSEDRRRQTSGLSKPRYRRVRTQLVRGARKGSHRVIEGY
jgi:hypothetical protein